MSSTITQPDLTPAELQAELQRLVKLMPGAYPHAYAYISLNSAPHVEVVVDLCDRDSPKARGEGATWREMVANCEAAIATSRLAHVNATIRKMALAVIELTDEHGKCTNLLLRNRKFTDADIAEFGDAACRRAAEMAGNAPFSIEAEGV